jgi:hypothetical protein
MKFILAILAEVEEDVVLIEAPMTPVQEEEEGVDVVAVVVDELHLSGPDLTIEIGHHILDHIPMKNGIVSPMLRRLECLIYATGTILTNLHRHLIALSTMSLLMTQVFPPKLTHNLAKIHNQLLYPQLHRVIHHHPPQLHQLLCLAVVQDPPSVDHLHNKMIHVGADSLRRICYSG